MRRQPQRSVRGAASAAGKCGVRKVSSGARRMKFFKTRRGKTSSDAGRRAYFPLHAETKSRDRCGVWMDAILCVSCFVVGFAPAIGAFTGRGRSYGKASLVRSCEDVPVGSPSLGLRLRSERRGTKGLRKRILRIPGSFLRLRCAGAALPGGTACGTRGPGIARSFSSQRRGLSVYGNGSGWLLRTVLPATGG